VTKVVVSFITVFIRRFIGAVTTCGGAVY
jgi:hypothetical protein